MNNAVQHSAAISCLDAAYPGIQNGTPSVIPDRPHQKNQPSPARGPNAFSILSASAEKAFQAHYFYTGVHNGTWCSEICPVGQAPRYQAHDKAAWSAQARVTFKPRPTTQSHQHDAKQPAAAGARQGEIRLRCNSAGGAAAAPQTADGRRLVAALQQPVPSGERYTAGAPLLKSALQVSSF